MNEGKKQQLVFKTSAEMIKTTYQHCFHELSSSAGWQKNNTTHSHKH
jgi:hypothetical protein